jgi:hypothetical protein
MLVKVERHDAVAVVTLNRPEAMNALSSAMRAELAQVMRDVDADESIRAVVLTGAGERAFTAGLDLKELGSDTSKLGDANAGEAERNPVKAVEQCRKPVIGAINGVAITGGFELALARLGALAEALADDWHFASERAVADGQLHQCGSGLRLGAGEPRGSDSRPPVHMHCAGAGHGKHRAAYDNGLQGLDRRRLRLGLR